MPSGFEASQNTSPSQPTTPRMISAISRIVWSRPQPTLRWETLSPQAAAYWASESCITNTQAAAMSSTCRNSRRADPVPQSRTAGSAPRTSSGMGPKRSASRRIPSPVPPAPPASPGGTCGSWPGARASSQDRNCPPARRGWSA